MSAAPPAPLSSSSSSGPRPASVVASVCGRASLAVSRLTDAAADGSGGVAELPRLRSEARAKNKHAQDPLMDGLVILEQEHDAISAALSALVDRAAAWCERKEGDPQAVDTLLSQTVALIAQHASVEERYVYPLFSKHLKGAVEGVTAASIYERNVADDNLNKEMMDLLMGMKMQKDSDLMLATLKKLQLIEEEHLTQEEYWFALLRSRMTAPSLRALADTLRAVAKTSPTRPHSVLGPSRAALSRVMHPVAGLLDRAMDRAAGRDTGLETRQGGAKQIKSLQQAQAAGQGRGGAAAEMKVQEQQERKQ